MIYAAIIFTTACAAYFNAMMDLSSEGSRGLFLGRRISAKGLTYKNKWKMTGGLVKRYSYNNLTPWYYLGMMKLPRDERFPFSSTVLVWLTDDWHFFKMVFLLFTDTSVVLLLPFGWWSLLAYVILPVVRFVVFEWKYKEKRDANI